jgi:hypothetical protein
LPILVRSASTDRSAAPRNGALELSENQFDRIEVGRLGRRQPPALIAVCPAAAKCRCSNSFKGAILAPKPRWNPVNVG